MRPAVLVALVLALPPRASAAEEVALGGHLCAGLGYGTDARAGFRADLHAGVHLGQLPFVDEGPRGFSRGWLVGLAGDVGLRAGAPAALALESGFLTSDQFTALGVAAGPALRLSPRWGGGGQLRVWANVLILEIGLKAMVLAGGGGGTEVRVLGLAGLGVTLL